jgi:hypothetical protein
MGYPGFAYYGNYWPQQGVPGQPGAGGQAGSGDASAASGWDSAAAAAYYQQGNGWGNYYGTSPLLQPVSHITCVTTAQPADTAGQHGTHGSGH